MNAEKTNKLLQTNLRRLLPWLLLAALAVVTSAHADEAMGGIKITTKPSGAKVYVDGKLKGKTPMLLEVASGMHDIQVRNPGYKTVKKRIKVSTDKIVRLSFTLTKEKTKKTAKTTTNQIRVHDTKAGGKDSGPGTVTVVTSPPGLTVFLDEYYIPQPTPVAFDVKAGVYELRVEQDGDTVYRKTVFVQAGRTLDLDLVIKKTRKIDYSDPWK